MRNVNKTVILLSYIAKHKLTEQSSLLSDTTILNLYSNTQTTTPKRRIIDTCNILYNKGYLSIGEVDDQKVYKITEKGLKHLNDSNLNQPDIIKKTWNGRWYLVCFEVADNKKSARNQLIILLKRHGFQRYSKSVWIIPYNPINLIDKIKTQLSLKKEINLVVASHIEKETKFKKLFDLN